MNYTYKKFCLTVLNKFLPRLLNPSTAQIISSLFILIKKLTINWYMQTNIIGIDNSRIMITPKSITNKSDISAFSICDILWFDSIIENGRVEIITAKLSNITLEDGTKYPNALISYSVDTNRPNMIYLINGDLFKVPIIYTVNTDNTFIKISKIGNSIKLPLIKQVISFNVKLPY